MGPTFESILTDLVRYADRNMQAEVVVTVDGKRTRYWAKVWKDGTIALRPIR